MLPSKSTAVAETVSAVFVQKGSQHAHLRMALLRRIPGVAHKMLRSLLRGFLSCGVGQGYGLGRSKLYGTGQNCG